MRKNPITLLRAMYHYSRALFLIEKKEYDGARVHLQKSLRLIGDAAHRPSSFEFYIRMSIIDLRTMNLTSSAYNAELAISMIKAHLELSEIDKLYLVDFCNVLLTQARREGVWTGVNLPSNKYKFVRTRYLRYYPLVRQ